jgi:hypothetical protein
MGLGRSTEAVDTVCNDFCNHTLEMSVAEQIPVLNCDGLSDPDIVRAACNLTMLSPSLSYAKAMTKAKATVTDPSVSCG